MRMRGNEVIDLLNVVALQRVDDGFALRRVARVDEHRLAGRRGDEYRVSIDRANIEHADREFTTRGGRRMIAQPGSNELPVSGARGHGNHKQNCNRTTATSSSSSHSKKTSLHNLAKLRRPLTSTVQSVATDSCSRSQ